MSGTKQFKIMFLELPDYQVTVHYLGIPYLIEGRYVNGHVTIDNISGEVITDDIIDNIIKKHFILNKNI